MNVINTEHHARARIFNVNRGDEMNKKLTYSIQQVAEMTGLSKQVIRKWEDRYGIITPQRLDNGYRIYSPEEVALLKKIIKLKMILMA